MSNAYIDPKKIAEIGQALLEEAILAVLAEAYTRERQPHKKYLKKEDIGERAGIYMFAKYPWTHGIVASLAAKLEKDGKIVNGKWEQRPYGETPYRYDRWKLAKRPIV